MKEWIQPISSKVKNSILWISFSGQCKMNLNTNKKYSLIYCQKQIKANDLIENTIQKT